MKWPRWLKIGWSVRLWWTKKEFKDDVMNWVKTKRGTRS